MKLKKAYIQAFGKFSNTLISFSPTLNLIYGENESGKSTLGKFIFHMLYGQKKYGVKKRIYLPDYEQYFPWNSSLYQGVLQYSLDKNIYRIERNFHMDFEEVRIFDDKTGQDITNCFHYDARKELQFLTQQIGLNQQYFKNTVYVEQNEMKGLLHKNKDSVLEELLGKTIYGINAENHQKTIKQIIKGLEKRKKEIGSTNNKSKPLGSTYNDLQKKLQEKYELDKKINSYKEYQQTFVELSQQLEQIQKRKKELESEKNYLNKKMIKNKIDVIEELLEEKQELQKYIHENFSNNIKQCSLEELYSEKKIIDRNEKQSLLVSILWMSIEGILVMSASFFWNLWFFLLIIIVLFFFIREILKRKNIHKNKEKLFYKIEKFSQYQDALNEMKRLQEKIKEETSMYSLEELKDKYQHLEQQDIKVSFNMNLDDIEKLLKELDEKERKLIREKTLYEVKIQEKNLNPLRLKKIEREIYRLENIIKNLEENIQAIDISISTFKKLEKEQRLEYLPHIIKKTEENIYRITKKYHTIKVDDEYRIKTLDAETKKLIPIENLSQGTCNQFYFSLRLGFIQGLSPKPIYLPIILDEPFLSFDNKRFEESMNLLISLSKKHQVIIFTSQKREKDYLDRNKIQYHYIEL
ncbi:ATP-binding protein [Garciella nitratireducens]|uniref:AAA domain-containing protein n=1 Tax=Garciella nitratireducens DSM 15102 TaxID=1121911 RepID=A0A1T4K856_9FIRM|nr:AAA family ATPase [Garciella nitratireducens]SJZ38591.1 AAA domain-containing protein [Garciella nitratireducens DSM 15102]